MIFNIKFNKYCEGLKCRKINSTRFQNSGKTFCPRPQIGTVRTLMVGAEPYIIQIPPYVNNTNVLVSNGPFKLLGFFISANKSDDMLRLNFQPKLSRFKNILHIWASCSLPPISRNIIFKRYKLSHFVYLL